jgi:ClpX C4-type zinc finger
MRQPDTNVLSCSFCHKSQDSVWKLISSPSDYPRAYICDECIVVCASILDDDRDRPTAVSGTPGIVDEKHPLLEHRLASTLLAAVERWVRCESLGGAAQELAEIRRIAAEMMDPPGLTGPGASP